MKKHFGLILAILAIAAGALGVAWFGEGNAPHMNDTPGRSLQKINDLLLIASTNTATVTVSNLTIGSVGVTNHLTVPLRVSVTNASLAVTGNVGFTNTSIAISGSVSANVTNASLTVAGNVGGYTLVTNLTLDVDRTAAGITANDILAPGLEVQNAVRTTGGTGILKCVTLATGDNIATPLRLLISGAALTWGTTNTVAYLTGSEFGNIQGIVDFTTADFKLIGTNYFATKDVSVGIKPAVNSVYVYAITTGAVTNTNTAGTKIKFTIFQD